MASSSFRRETNPSAVRVDRQDPYLRLHAVNVFVRDQEGECVRRRVGRDAHRRSPRALQYSPRTDSMKCPIWFSAAFAFFTVSLGAQLAQPPAEVSEGVVKQLMNACPSNPQL